MVLQGEFPLQQGMIGRATRLAVMGVSPMILRREARWISNALTANVRANNMEDTLRVSRVLSGRKYSRRKQPGQGTRCGKYKEEEYRGKCGRWGVGGVGFSYWKVQTKVNLPLQVSHPWRVWWLKGWKEAGEGELPRPPPSCRSSRRKRNNTHVSRITRLGKKSAK